MATFDRTSGLLRSIALGAFAQQHNGGDGEKGSVLRTSELESEYDFTDVDGRQPLLDNQVCSCTHQFTGTDLLIESLFRSVFVFELFRLKPVIVDVRWEFKWKLPLKLKV